MNPSGYYRYPTIHDDNIIFVSEDDLWQVSVSGGTARRLTSNLGAITHPKLSPDGQHLAFVGREEGAAEVYVMPAMGGRARRLTYLSSQCQVVGWNQSGTTIIFASSYGQVAPREMALFQVAVDGTNGQVDALPHGPARAITFGVNGEVVLGRNTGEPAQWKRYRGGTAGHLWIDRNGDGDFERFLPDLAGNITSPIWYDGEVHEKQEESARIFFVSDHEGIGNLYACRPDGSQLTRLTDHSDYYVRNPHSDGSRIVYHAGADLYVYDIVSGDVSVVDVEYHSPRVQRNRKFVYAGAYLNSASLHPSGKAMTVTVRGKPFAFFNFDGPVVQFGRRAGVRYRLAEWLNDGRRLVVVSDEPGEEAIEVHDTDPDVEPLRFDGIDLGRPISLKVSPVDDLVAIANHRHELLILDVANGTLIAADRSDYRRISGFDWSPDGRWLAYGCSVSPQTTAIRLYRLPEALLPSNGQTEIEGENEGENDVGEGEIFTITKPILHDVSPAFDPDGKYLYFLSYREFNPVYDGLHFDLGFPWGMRPYLVTLRDDLINPFLPRPDVDAPGGGGSADDGDADKELDDLDYGRRFASMLALPDAMSQRSADALMDSSEDENQPEKQEDAEHDAPGEKKDDAEKTAKQLRIDLDGIERRIYAFPVPDGRYGTIAGIKDKAIFSEFPIEGQFDNKDSSDEEAENEYGSLRMYDFKEYRSETLVDGVTWFELSRNGEQLLYASGRNLRVIASGDKPPSGGGHPRKTGWIDLNRLKVSVSPHHEWEQMFREAWRLQRDHFWTEDMSEVDWQAVYQRYFPLIKRVSTRSEFSDLMWEMQGELGTSHAYEFGGDYRRQPQYRQGLLGVTVTWDADAEGYRIEEIIEGDAWDSSTTSPLADAGLDVAPGDVIRAINGQRLDESTGPAQLLVNQAGQEVLLTLAAKATEADEGGGDEAGTEMPGTDEAAAVDSDLETADIAMADIAMADVDETDASEAHQDGTTNATADEPPVVDEPAAGDESSGSGSRHISVRTIFSEAPARYRTWVEGNRRYVHEQTDGKVGYIHIPDMGPTGYAEFHRGYLAESNRDALVIDVRYNGGGHVSQLILEKLARRRIGYDWSRWGGLVPYPLESAAGPMVALTNEHAGSDGDIFCHSFKLMKLGPLVGKRTWGGVIGIHPRHALVDGTITTQPEFSFWFEDVGWNVENYGTDPDIEVDITPQDYRNEHDPQLDRAIAEAQKLLSEVPIVKPNIGTRPSRALPALPPRP